MAALRQTFDAALSMMTELFEMSMSGWGIFGTFIVFCALIRAIAWAFNKIKS